MRGRSERPDDVTLSAVLNEVHPSHSQSRFETMPRFDFDFQSYASPFSLYGWELSAPFACTPSSLHPILILGAALLTVCIRDAADCR